MEFSQISPVIYRLVVSLAANPWTGREHLSMLAAEVGLAEDALLEPGKDLLDQRREDGAILGTMTMR